MGRIEAEGGVESKDLGEGIMPRRYPVQLEIAGPAAMFARPDTGGTPTSYPVPTFSACKGIFESIAWLKEGSAWIRPTKVEICKLKGASGGTVRFQRYTTNYRGPLRKSNQLRSESSFQLVATIVVDVCYRLYGEIEGSARDPKRGNNVRHYLKDLFERRLRQGRCHRTPCLGWSEFTATYWGKFRDGTQQSDGPCATEVDTEISLTIPSMLYMVWHRPQHGNYEPRFLQNVEVRKGVLRFAE